MEPWLFYAIISMFVTGLFNFGFKIITKKNYNTSLVSIISYGTAAFLAGISYLTSTAVFDIHTLGIIVLLAAINFLFYFLSTIARVEAMNNIDTTIFFPIYKTLFPTLFAFISFFYFRESINEKEFVGIILGILIPLFLITKGENTIQKNLKIGLILCVLTSILAGISTLANKFVSVLELDKGLFVFLGCLLGTFIASISYKFFDHSGKKKYSKNGIYLFSGILGLLQFIGFISFTHSLQGNLAIVITINSFSILIPIILSVWFYGEEMTLRKGFVTFLSIISIVLFI